MHTCCTYIIYIHNINTHIHNIHIKHKTHTGHANRLCILRVDADHVAAYPVSIALLVLSSLLLLLCIIIIIISSSSSSMFCF